MKTLQEVKEHFKNAKEVRFVNSKYVLDISNAKIRQEKQTYQAEIDGEIFSENDYHCLYSLSDNKFAEIISYKSTKEKTPKKELKALLSLAKECLEKPNSEVCQTYKDKILDACPSLKVESDVLEVGQWYELKTNETHYFICLKKIELDDIYKGSIGHKHYGFRNGKYHIDSWANTDMSKSLKKADPKKVEELLIAECKKKGIWDNDNVVCLFHKKSNVNSIIGFIQHENSLWGSNGMLFRDGIFAKPIETISLSEAERRLNLKIKID